MIAVESKAEFEAAVDAYIAHAGDQRLALRAALEAAAKVRAAALTGIDLDLAGIRARAEAAERAQSGIWEAMPCDAGGWMVATLGDIVCCSDPNPSEQSEDPFLHIASADPPTVIAMCDLIERQAGELQRAVTSIAGLTPRAIAAETKVKKLCEALYRLKTECEMDGLANKAGYDCWIALANEALTPKEDTPCRTA